jgi:Rieske Fe-S protein
VPASDVPVDGGAVLRDEKLVVTQPSRGEFKAFSAVCTHQGCVVAEVTDGQIVCPCHGSHFSIEDGAPVSGPAKAPLAAKKVQVNGTKITITLRTGRGAERGRAWGSQPPHPGWSGPRRRLSVADDVREWT